MSARARARAAAGALATAIFASVLGPAAAAAEDEDTGTLAVQVTEITPTVMTRRDTLSVDVTISNTSLDAVSRPTAQLRVTDAPLATTADALAWLAGAEEAPVATRTVRETRAGGPRGIEPEGSTRVGFRAPRGRLGLGPGAAGVYGLEVFVEDASGSRSVRTLLPWYGAPVAAQPMVVIGTVAGPEARARALLFAASARQVTIAVDPTALRGETGVFAPLDRDAYLLPAGHLDVASLVGADQRRLVERAVESSRQSFQGEADWIAVVPAVDRRLETAARSMGAGVLLIDARQAVPGQPALGLTPAGTPVVHPDRDLSLAVSDADPAAATSAPTVLGLSLLGALETGSAPIVVAPGARWQVAADVASPLVQQLLDAPWTAPATLTTAMRDWEPGEAEVLETAPVGESIPAGVITQAATALASARLTAAASTDPAGVAGAAEASLLRALSYDGRLNTESRAEAIDAAVDALYAVRNGVYITGVSDVNLVSSTGDLPVTVRNDLPAEVTVRVAAATDSPNLVVHDAPAVEVPAGGEAQVLVPVNAISSANVNLKLWLEDDAGQRLTSGTEIRVRVRAQWGDTFTWVIAGGFVLLLIAGIIRTARRGRGDTRESPTTEQPTPDVVQEDNG